MKGDFSRETFDKQKSFSRVLMQQGRVLLDADWNEQTAILLHYLRTLTTDVIGRHFGRDDSFKIDFSRNANGIVTDAAGNPKDLTVSEGNYYVDGILCENAEPPDGKSVSYFNQPHYQPPEEALSKFPYLVYLDVWERHVAYFEDESLREVALGEIDTTTRAQIVWQVKLHELTSEEAQKGCRELQPPKSGSARLSAGALRGEDTGDPCLIEPDARYRGAENQLYRVEIHTGNVDDFGNQNSAAPTFKWSRENGSVVFAVESVADGSGMTEVQLANLGRDEKLDLREGDWVELSDDAYTLSNRADKLLQIISIDRDESRVSLKGKQKFPISDGAGNHPLLRRWDQKIENRQKDGSDGDDADNAVEIVENEWLTLEDGIQIRFEKAAEGNFGESAEEKPEPIAGITARYRTGDYWLIPARTMTGDVIWAKDKDDQPIPQPARGIEHHYAPLAIAVDRSNLTSCRCLLKPMTDCAANVIGTTPNAGGSKGTTKPSAKPKDKDS